MPPPLSSPVLTLHRIRVHFVVMLPPPLPLAHFHMHGMSSTLDAKRVSFSNHSHSYWTFLLRCVRLIFLPVLDFFFLFSTCRTSGISQLNDKGLSTSKSNSCVRSELACRLFIQFNSGIFFYILFRVSWRGRGRGGGVWNQGCRIPTQNYSEFSFSGCSEISVDLPFLIMKWRSATAGE